MQFLVQSQLMNFVWQKHYQFAVWTNLETFVKHGFCLLSVPCQIWIGDSWAYMREFGKRTPSRTLATFVWPFLVAEVHQRSRRERCSWRGWRHWETETWWGKNRLQFLVNDITQTRPSVLFETDWWKSTQLIWAFSTTFVWYDIHIMNLV